MRGLKGAVCVCVCVAFPCFHARDSCPGEKGPGSCLQHTPLFKRRGLHFCVCVCFFLQSPLLSALPSCRFRCPLLLSRLTMQMARFYFHDGV